MDGILIIDKESGMTSRDVVNIVGKNYKTKKIGHTGTLDPLATGVLVVCVNRATKIAELLTSLDKEYVAEFILGRLTDTLDIEGNLLKSEETNFTKDEVLQACKKLIGSYTQTVPIYSAVKVNGKKLYEYARENIDVELPKHNVTISSIELLDINRIDNQTVIKIKTKVSKGTYIRSLGNDIANILGTNAIMSSLRRIKQGEFDIKDAIKLSDIKNNTPLIPIKDCLNKYTKIKVNEKIENDILNGKLLNNTYNKSEILFIDKDENPIALYKIYDKDNSKIKPWKMFKIKN